MSVDGPEVRLSDAERQEALEALDEHVRTGRLDVDEYGERTARATAARTRGDLEPLFVDLPQPKPAVLVTTAEPAAPGHRPEPRGRRIPEMAVPAAAIIAVVLFFVIKIPFVFLLPVLVALLVGGFSGRKR